MVDVSSKYKKREHDDRCQSHRENKYWLSSVSVSERSKDHCSEGKTNELQTANEANPISGLADQVHVSHPILEGLAVVPIDGVVVLFFWKVAGERLWAALKDFPGAVFLLNMAVESRQQGVEWNAVKELRAYAEHANEGKAEKFLEGAERANNFK
jgi:hypothetical protein